MFGLPEGSNGHVGQELAGRRLASASALVDGEVSVSRQVSRPLAPDRIVSAGGLTVTVMIQP
jgi:hypothetical protein